MTISLELPDALMCRVDVIANLTGKSSKVLMVEMITEHTNRAEKRQAFIQSELKTEKLKS